MRFEMRCSLLFAFAFTSIVFSFSSPKCTNAYQADELSEDEAKQVQATERFLKVLEKSPRRGTALDRVYGHHVEFGSLDKFLEQLNQRVAKDDKDTEAWMLLGLFESQRGTDAAAVEAFRKAATLRPQDPLAPYYLGQSLLRIGQSVEAVAAFEQALARKPTRNDLLEIFQQLGRVHQRAQRTDEALKVWQRLETLFPEDPRVLEQIAVTLAEEGGYALALPRYQRLAELVKDDYRRVLFRVEAAGLKIKTNKRDEGIADMEGVLTDLNPESWLYRDVRRRIENIFLKSGDQDNLVKYYQKWLGTHPDDIEAMTRLAKFLASSARIPEAKEWMEKALKLAPSRSELRKAFIDQLVDDQRIPDAIKQYEQLVATAPGNPDFLRDWGKLVLKDKSQDIEVRRKEATRIWNQIIAARPNDASTLAQVADFFRQANLNDEATSLYQKASEIAPNDPQYREYLGEFLHIQKRTDEALKTWASIAEGPRHTAANVTRLAEVFSSFGFNDQAVTEIAVACLMDPKDFSLQIRGADYHMRADKFDDAMKFVAAAEKLAANDDEREGVVKQRIEILQSSQQLDAEIDMLTNALRDNASATAVQWHLLARYQEADRQWSPAAEAIDAAMKLDEKSIPILTTAAKIAEASGDFGRAAEMNRKLAAVDRRSLGDHLMNVARLEAQLGRTEEALKAAQNLIVSAPGNTDNYEFLAQMCFRMSKPVEGLEALRKAVRINPNEPHLIMALGAALADQLRTDEAIEVYWRAFDKSDDLDDKTSLTLKLVPLYQQINQFDKLIERFERDRREEEKRREMTICLAQAHNLAGDYGTARQELESLLSQDTRDTNLLQQLAKLCEGGSDLEAAIGYQRQLVAIAPGNETEFPLAKMLQSRGDRDEATEILVKLTRREEDPIRLLKSIDSLLTQSSMEAVLSITEPLLSQQRDDWELLYREGVAWSMLNKPAEANNRFTRLLAVTLPHDAMGVSAEAKFKQAQSKARSDNLRGTITQLPTRQSPLKLVSMASQVQRTVGLTNDNYYSSSSGPQAVWMPETFGVARMASYGWILRFEEDAKSESSNKVEPTKSIADTLAERANDANANRDTIYDFLYVSTLKFKNDDIFNIARRLAKSGGKEELQNFLSTLRLRGIATEQVRIANSGQATQKKSPLSVDDLKLMMTCYDNLNKGKLDESDSAISTGQVIYSNGQMYVNSGNGYVLVSGVSGGSFLGIVIEELKLAGQQEQVDALLSQRESEAKTASQLAGLMGLLFEQEKTDRLQELYLRWVAQAKQEIAKAATVIPTRQNRGTQSAGQQVLGMTSNLLMRWMGKLGPEEKHAQIFSILDPALDLAIVNAKQRRADRSRLNQHQAATTRSTNSGQFNYSLVYGKENIQATIDFPRPNDYVDQTTQMLLREVYEVFKRNDVLSDFSTHLRKRVERATEDVRLYEQLILASVLWWSEEPEESVELMSKAADSLKEDMNFRFEMAAMREIRGDLDEALEIVEAIVPKDQQLLQRKELMALQIAERLGDNDRALVAMERLFGLRLDNTTQLNLAQRMRRLGLHEMADAVISRVERKSGNQASSLLSLMTMYQAQGKMTEAKQIAHMLLQRTNSQSASMTNSTRNPFRSNQSGDVTRRQALQLLLQSGDLKTLISKAEEQLARSPESQRLYEQLLEFYTAQGERAKIGELLEKSVKQKPDSYVLRYQLAKNLESNNKMKEACDQYLVLIKLKPEWVAEDLNSIRNLFQRTNRTMELAEALRTINIRRIQQPFYITNLVSSLMQDEKNTDIAVELFVKVFDAFPNYRSNMISNVSNPKMWSNDRIFEIGKRSFIPLQGQTALQPWYGIDQIRSYSGDGNVNGMFSGILESIRGTPKTAELQKAITQAVENDPNWLGGKAMLGILDLAANQKEQGQKKLVELLQDENVLKAIPSDTCWLIGQELDKFQESRPLALKLYEHAITSPNQSSMRQMQYSPISRLVKIYGDSGRKDEAKTMLLKNLRGLQLPNYDAEYSSSIKIENSFYVANKLLDMGFPIEAVRLYRESTIDPIKMEQAANWNGRQPDYFSNQAKTGISKALASLNEATAGEAVTQLLSVPETIPPGTAVLDLMLTMPDIKTIQSKKMESGLLNLFQSIAKADIMKSAVDKRLIELQEKYPADLSVRTAIALFRHQMKLDGAMDSFASLLAHVKANPMDTIAEGKRPNSRQRREALLSVSLWLVARECLGLPDLQSTGQQLAERALEAARRQTGSQHSMTILFDWGTKLHDTGDHTNAELKLAELLKIATERPQRKAADPTKAGLTPPQLNQALPPGVKLPPGVNIPPALAQRLAEQAAGQKMAPGVPPQASTKRSAPDTVPPLTMSQFNLVMAIASFAAENNMPKLSKKAANDSLSGGIPVDDPNPVATSSSRQMIGMSGGYSVTTNAVPNTSSGIESQVARSFQSLVSKWKGDEYSSQDVYDLLKPLVFPTAKASEILMFADSSGLKDAKVSSLGESLIAWAKRANKLHELDAEIELRKNNPSAILIGTTMQTMIAIVSGDHEKSKVLMEDLQSQCIKGVSPALLQTACHAAIPASSIVSLKEPAFLILKKALEQQTQSASGNSNQSIIELQPIGKLAEIVNRFIADSGDTESVKKYFDSLIVSRQPIYARYSGDSGLNQQKRDIANFASEAARIGMPSIAMDFAGRAIDIQLDRYGSMSLKIPFALFDKHLKTKPANERFDAWYAWTMPNEGRQTIRFATEWIAPTFAPEAFLKLGGVQSKPLDTELVCNLTELVAAARETGNLDKLKVEAEKAAEQKFPNADTLLALVTIELVDLKAAEPLIRKAVEQLLERRSPQGLNVPLTQRPPATLNISYGNHFVLFRACMQSPQFAALYQDAFGPSPFSIGNLTLPSMHSQSVFEFAKRKLKDANASVQPGEDSGLIHWLSASNLSERTAKTDPWWTVQEGRLTYLAGSGSDVLCFKYPLQGDFEFSVESHRNTGGEVGYGGVVCQPSSVLALSGGETINSSTIQRNTSNLEFGSNRIQVNSESQKVLLDRREIYSEANTRTSPWITLLAGREQMTSFRNFQINGSPSIPREVKLIDGDSMDGWNCTFFGETRYKKRLMSIKTKGENDSNAFYQQREPATFDWTVKDGVLTAEGTTDLQDPKQSWIFYHRPLQNEESIRYEFFHQAGQFVAHPTIGRVAILLEPAGLQSHWIGAANTDDVLYGIPLDNAIVEPSCRRGPESLPLKPEAWNYVDMTFKNNVATVSLNGVVVYQRPHESQLDTRFGVFRYKNQSTKIRNAILTGPWPTELTPEIRQNLLATKGPRSSVDQRAIHSITSDRFFDSDAKSIVAKAAGLADEQAFDLLKKWTLPSDDHANFRLYYSFALLNENRSDSISEESHLVSPSIELVRVASKLNRLPELIQLVQNAEATDAIQIRNRNALLALIAVEQGDVELVRSGIAKAYASIAANELKNLAMRDRAAEFVVAWQAAKNPALASFASDIAIGLTTLENNKETRSNILAWKTHLGILRGRIALIERGINKETPNGISNTNESMTQWANIPFLNPMNRSAGLAPSRWLFRRGALQHIPSGTSQMLYFQSPLRGKFEIVAKRSTYNDRDVEIAYGMQSVEPVKDKQAISINKLIHANNEVEKKLDVPNTGDLFEFRIEVDGSTVTTTINGVVVHKETYSAPPDPWIILQSKSPYAQGVIRDLRIVGNPEIPNEINLIDIGVWAGWRADHFEESYSTYSGTTTESDLASFGNSSGRSSTSPWQLTGEEIVGTLRTNLGTQPRESLLMYQRPMLEDGEIEWESFHSTGEVEVHPAIGRVAFLIRSSGVQLHRLTDGSYETSDLTTDNAIPLEGASAVEIKEKDWNKFKLSLKGDRMILAVNAKEVAHFTVTEKTSQRYFGLFRYSNQTHSRVRNLIYRGGWPKVLPLVKDQELAYPMGGPIQLSSDTNIQTTTIILGPSLEAIQKQGLKLDGRADQFTPTDKGLKIEMRNASLNEDRPAIKLPLVLDKDCEITVEFEGLTVTSAEKGWGTIFSLVAYLNDAEQSEIECAATSASGERMLLSTTVRRLTPEGKYHKPESLQVSRTKPTGRMRLVRTGSEIHSLFADSGSEDFELIQSIPIGKSGIKSISIEAKSSDDAGKIDVTVKQITVRTQ